jgi:hypothetical protein
MEESKSQIEVSLEGVSPMVGLDRNYVKNIQPSFCVDNLNLEKASVVSNEILDVASQN